MQVKLTLSWSRKYVLPGFLLLLGLGTGVPLAIVIIHTLPFYVQFVSVYIHELYELGRAPTFWEVFAFSFLCSPVMVVSSVTTYQYMNSYSMKAEPTGIVLSRGFDGFGIETYSKYVQWEEVHSLIEGVNSTLVLLDVDEAILLNISSDWGPRTRDRREFIAYVSKYLERRL